MYYRINKAAKNFQIWQWYCDISYQYKLWHCSIFYSSKNPHTKTTL